MTGIKLDSEDSKQDVLKKLQNHIDHILAEYYTVNITNETAPDLVASITNINDMSSIPDGYFENIIFENVDSLIWMNQTFSPFLKE